MLALTYFMPTGALSTLFRGIALAAIIVFAVIACASVAPILWPLCCTIAASAVTCACSAAVCAAAMAVPFVIMKLL